MIALIIVIVVLIARFIIKKYLAYWKEEKKRELDLERQLWVVKEEWINVCISIKLLWWHLLRSLVYLCVYIAHKSSKKIMRNKRSSKIWCGKYGTTMSFEYWRKREWMSHSRRRRLMFVFCEAGFLEGLPSSPSNLTSHNFSTKPIQEFLTREKMIFSNPLFDSIDTIFCSMSCVFRSNAC